MEEVIVKAQIVDRMSLLGAHLTGRVEHGLYDVTSAIETLYREVLTLTHGWNLTSTNFPDRNFPAVDLHDTEQRLAIQVTATCDSAKIRKTQNTFIRHGLDSEYDRLIFVGVTSVQKSKHLAPWAEILTQSAILNLENLSLSQLSALDERLATSTPWHRFTERSDRHCFEVVLGVLDRDAIRHRTSMEGNFNDMLVGLRQIKQIINQGQFDGSRIQAKPLSHYSAPYAEILEEIDAHVGHMASIVKRKLNREYNFLPFSDAEAVDEERQQLVQKVNEFCTQNNCPKRIAIWEGHD